VIGGWVVLLLPRHPFAPQCRRPPRGRFVLDDLPSSTAARPSSASSAPPSALVVVFDSATPAGTPAFEAARPGVIAAVPSAPHVTDVSPTSPPEPGVGRRRTA
jgi:hypothetical protein